MTDPRFDHAMTATEFLSILEKDEDYQRRKRKADEEMAERRQVIAVASRPILEDLRHVGYDVTSVYMLGSRYDSYPEALPILMKHLEKGGYPDIFLDQMARLMGVRYAEAYWDRIRALYDKYDDPSNDVVAQGLAVALGDSAKKDRFEDLVELLRDQSHGQSRVLFISPILRIGRERGWVAIESVADDPVVGEEAKRSLHQRELRRRAKVRREARGR